MPTTRTAYWRRFQRQRHILRKKRIARALYGRDYYEYNGMYDKGKIHCSCWMCSSKRRHHGITKSEKSKLMKGLCLEV